ncbi:DUF4240 domain-containing protein [Streptomyces sp. NBC_01310]|nr:DUF4240 domain-containing protein [Streptomyces sp. NBC_01310]
MVAAGRDVHESVFEDTARFSPFTATTMQGESLLYVAQQAYERKLHAVMPSRVVD